MEQMGSDDSRDYKRICLQKKRLSERMESRRTTSLSKLIALYIVKSDLFNLHHSSFDSLRQIEIEMLRSLDGLRKKCYQLLYKNQKLFAGMHFLHHFASALSISLRYIEYI